MIEITNLTKCFGDKKVVDDVSFDLKEGEICALLGLNGAGKSTIMKTIATLIYPNSGIIKVDGKDLYSKKNNIIQKKIGFMIEEPIFYPQFTGYKNLSLYTTLIENFDKSDINKVLELTGLAQASKVKYKNYSLGMKQRLYFAYALLKKPRYLILDEPFNGIDPVSVKIFKDLIKIFSEKGCGILVSSHMIADLQSICNKVIIVNNGKIVVNKKINEDDNMERLFFDNVNVSGILQ